MRKIFSLIVFTVLITIQSISAQEKVKLSVFPFENKSDKFYDWMGYGFSYLLSEGLSATNVLESVPQDSIYAADSDPNINLKNIYTGAITPSFQLYHMTWKANYSILGQYTITGDTAIDISYKICLLQKKALTQATTVKGKFGKYTDVYLTYLKLLESIYADFIGFDVIIDRPAVERSHDKLRSMIAGYDGLQAYIKKWITVRHYDTALRLAEEKNYDRALDYFNFASANDEYKTLNISENMSKTYVLRGTSAANDKKWDEAEKDFLAAISFDSLNADAYFSLGTVNKEKKDFDQAEINYQKATDLKPSLVAAYVNLGYVFDQQGDFNAAVMAYEKAKKLDEKNANILYYQAVAYDNLADVARARPLYEEALTLDSTLAGAYLNLGIIYKQMKDAARAGTYYQRALTYDPNSALAHRNLGILLMNNKKEAAQALFHLEKTIELDPAQDDAAVIKKNIEILKKKVPKKKKK